MATLKEILLTCLNDYLGQGLNGFSELTQNLDQTLFIVRATGIRKGNRFSFDSLIVRIIDEKIIIEEDRNSDPLYEALVQAGIPREQIILAYAGETIPDTV
jgi:hypothetical protein